jgi:hypothetical protein
VFDAVPGAPVGPVGPTGPIDPRDVETVGPYDPAFRISIISAKMSTAEPSPVTKYVLNVNGATP